MFKSKFNFNKVTILSKDQQRMIKGGSTAIAECDGSKPVICSGDISCEAQDNVGCVCKDSSGADDAKTCALATLAGVF
ncbi:hypothetical protein BKI52_19445 [marine bacterium AO1-C]|nr:hypothetical protein BKI52_19445 [marine bacterium AO1-C]